MFCEEFSDCNAEVENISNWNFSTHSTSLRRPLQSYQVKEPTTYKPKPLSDEFSNEFNSGENYNSNNQGYNNNRWGE